MSQQEYGFCPKCGAVTKNGVCTSCGNKKKRVIFNKPSLDKNDSPSKQGYAARLVASVAFVIFFIVGLMTYHTVRFGERYTSGPVDLNSARGTYSSVGETSDLSVPEINTWNDDFFNTFAGRIYADFDYFDVPGEAKYAEESGYDYSDEHDFYVYDDYIRTDLEYKVLNKVWKYNGYNADIYGEEFPEYAFIRCDYPYIESDTLGFIDDVNDTIADLTTYMCDYCDIFGDYLRENEVFYGEEYVYVTYMSEDVLSLLFQYDGYYYNDTDEDVEPELALTTVKTVNFDMKTGKVMEMPELSVDEDVFLSGLVSDIDMQNGVSLLDLVSKEELIESYEDGEIQWFFNPIGVEFVYVFPDLYGYYSCTEDPELVFKK
ncbi:MAG: hypothetical protein J5626_10995 [Lachnospiraceae bacterium]|nr:hypothetical protein [Lachnospiraceae bacterium]